MRLVLLGAVQSTEVALRTLITAGEPPAHVVALDPSRAARHSDFVDIAEIADVSSIEATTVDSARGPEVRELLRGVRTDLLLVVGWSEILPIELFETAAHGAVGYHPSALPELRGRGVIPWTVMLQRERTAGTLFWLGEGLDDGDIAYQRQFSVAPRETATTLYEKHMDALAEMISELAKARSPQDVPRAPQEGQVSYCAQRRPVDGLIDWCRSAEECDRLIRASTHPYPGARAFRASDGASLCLWDSHVEEHGPHHHGAPGQVVAADGNEFIVTCGSGLLRLFDVTDPEGRRVRLRVQDRCLPFPLALQRWADLYPL